MKLLGIGSELSGGRAVLALRGELDLSTVPEAEASLLRLADESGDATIVLDLRELTFMDSTGLRFVLAANAQATQNHRPFAVVRGPETVHRVFRLALLEERLAFANTPEEVAARTGGGDA
jgi:anti-sigma B factor antagonist